MKTFGAAYINLLKTSIGSGVLNFPYLFKTYGIFLSVFLTLVSGFLAATGLVLLSICAHEVGRTADLSSLSRLAIPHARFFVNLSVFVKCFGVSASYIIITRQLLPPLVKTVLQPGSFFSQPRICLLIFLVLIGPTTYLLKLDRLKYTSFVGVASIAAVILATILRYSFQSTEHVTVKYFISPNIHWLGGLGKFIFSFTCHQNIFAVNAEMEDNSPRRMRKLICCVATTAFILYMSFGLPNYLLYGNAVMDNVLRNYPQDYLATAVRGLYVVVMGVSYPLQVVPARVYLLNMIDIPASKRKFNTLHVITTTLIILATYAIAVAEIELGMVYAIVGATASTFMALILPALFYFNLDVERSISLSIVAYCAFLFGIVVFGTTLVSIAMGIH